MVMFISSGLSYLDLPPPETSGATNSPSTDLDYLEFPPAFGPVTLVSESVSLYNFEPLDPMTQFGIKYLVPGYLTLRVYFTKLMTNNTALRNVLYYNITPTDGVVTLVTPGSGTYPEYVDLTTTALVDGRRYLLTITPDKLRSYDGEILARGRNSRYFDGVSNAPEPIHVAALSSTQMRVTFSTILMQDDDLLLPHRYTWTNRLVSLAVVQDTLYSVIVTTTQQEPDVVYTLTVT